MEAINLQVAYGAVKHFGRNLYTSNPPAIAELVANSWDAYCDNCHIINLDKSLLIVDDGIGMTNDEFSTRYAVSGTEKDTSTIRIPTEKIPRPYMGRKGIGKFSAFSLGEEYILYTKSELDDNWKKIKLHYSDLLVDSPTIRIPVQNISDLTEIDDLFMTDFKTLNYGTVIYIPEMRRKFIKSTADNLKNTLSRRFSVNVSEKYNFSLHLNSEEIDLTKHFYDSNLEFVYYFGFSLEEVKSRFPHLNEVNFFEIIDEFFQENNVSGWIGTVQQPKQLWISNEMATYGVVVYINGKLADENILKNKLNARISNAYVIGEVNADFLQNENEDPVLSSREGLNSEIENVEKLTEHVLSIRAKIDNTWNDLRAARTPERQDYVTTLLEKSGYTKTYNSLNRQQKKKIHKYAQRIFDNNEEHSKSEYRTYAPVIFSLVNSEIIDEIHVEEADDMENVLAKFYELFDKTEINSALRIQSNIEDRLAVIEELNKNIADEAVEQIFENHLQKHPWLIHPYWDKPTDRMVIETQNRYKYLVDEYEIHGRTDIIIKIEEEIYPIICELKREKQTSYSAPNALEIQSQIGKYRRGIFEEINKERGITASDIRSIKAFFICGQTAYDKLKEYDLIDLNNNNIEVLTYQDIIRRAKGIYHRAIEL